MASRHQNPHLYTWLSHLCVLSLLATQALSQTTANQPETSLLDPQYYDIASCPCDLQASVCDIGCCCDTACSATDKQLFVCTPGFYGGNSTMELYRRCSSTDRDNPDYHPFTCVLIEDYNAYLGKYYAVQPKVSDKTSWDAKYQAASAASQNYRFASETALGIIEATGIQRKGLVILQVPTGITSFSWSDSSTMANYRLALPRRTLGGACDRTAGVVYLEDFTSACDIRVTAALCQAGVASPLDAAVYATQCRSGSSTGCQALVQTRSIAGTAAWVPVTVTYSSLTSAFGYEKGLSSSSSTSSTVSRQSPSLSGEVCNHAVVRVEYSFVWSGSSLVSLEAAVHLATVNITSVVSQYFAASFTHLSALGTNSTSVVNSTAVKRSGVIGYEPGASLLSRDNATGATGSVSLWRATSEGGCISAAAPVLFQMDAISYCPEIVQLTEFNNCTRLRDRLKTKLKQQFSTIGKIGIFGSANASMTNDWVTVLEQDLVLYNSDNFTRNGISNPPTWISLSGVCLGVPTEIVLNVLYAEQGKANDTSIWQVVGAYLRYRQVNLTAACELTGCGSNNITLSTGVQFIRVPREWADSEAYFGPYKPICWWGICWSELAYPLTTDFEGESRAMCIAWVVFLVLVGFYVFCISIPWW